MVSILSRCKLEYGTVATCSHRRPLSVGGPAFKWDKYNDDAASPENTLDELQSVDIVLTSDQSKWSQCVVFETGDNPILDLPTGPDGVSTVPPHKGMLRNHYQLNKNGFL